MNTSKMRAARCYRYGAPDVIRVEEVARPTPSDNQVLVRVHAATVSRTDCALLGARPFFMRLMTGLLGPKLKTLGTDFAGIIEAVGANVTGFTIGQKVFGINDLGAGSHAEYLVVGADSTLWPMPGDVSFEQAAASLEGGWYAYSFLRRAGSIRPGARVLINGATGGIGSALLQFCVDAGADVTAVGNTKNLELLKTLGAGAVLDYERGEFTREAETGAYDCVFDAVGRSTFGATKHLLKPNGLYSSSELGPGCQNLPLAVAGSMLRGRRVVFPLPVPKAEYLAFVRPLLEGKRFRPVIERSYTLDEIRQAYAYAASGQKTGNLVLTLG